MLKEGKKQISGMEHNINTLGNLLTALLGNNPVYIEKLFEQKVLLAWPRAVGDRISTKCWPVKVVEKNVLLVASESSSWLHQLSFLEQQILEKLNRELASEKNRRKIIRLAFKIADARQRED